MCVIKWAPTRAQHAVKVLSMEMLPHCGQLAGLSYRAFLKESNSINYFYCQKKKKDLHMRTCCTFRHAGGVLAEWELPPWSFVTISLLRSSCGQSSCAAQHRPEGQAVHAWEHRTRLRPLRLTVLWITSSSVHDGLPIRITTPGVLEKWLSLLNVVKEICS